MLIAVVFVAATGVAAQTGGSSVMLKASVGETVALSIQPNSTYGDVDVDVVGSGNTVRITLAGTGANSAVVRVPLLVRSNISFRIAGDFQSETAVLTELSVLNARATGRLVSPEAVDNLEIPQQVDFAGPFVVLSGPRVSLGGTLLSSNNALQLTLLVRLQPQSAGAWTAQLTLAGAARGTLNN
jgi:hypothetical protein